MTIEYLSAGQVLALHAGQLRPYGGRTGLLDRGTLETALARAGGDPRRGGPAAIVFAESNRHEFLATPDELIETMLAAADGKMAAEEDRKH